MIVRVLTTCHTQYTWDSSMCIFLFNRTTLQVFVTYLTGALYVHPLWFYKHLHNSRVRSKLFVACQRWWFQWRFAAILVNCAPSGEKHNYCTSHIIKENFENFLIHRCNYILLSQVYCVWQVVKTPTIIFNNPVYNNNKGINIEIYTSTYNPLILRHVSIFFRSFSGGLHETGRYKAPLLMLAWYKLVENDLKKILTCRNIGRLYVEVYIFVSVHVLVLYIKWLINAQMWIILTHLNIRGRDSLAVILTFGTVRGSNPGGGEIFCTRPDRRWSPPNHLHRVFQKELYNFESV
jgi:hypothetical protein